MRVWSRILWALGYTCAFLLLLILGFLAIEVLSGFASVLVGAVVFLAAALAFFKGLSILAPEPDGLPTAEAVPAASLDDSEDLLSAFVTARGQAWESAQAALDEHRGPLADLPPLDRRMELLHIWRQAIDGKAHAYADLVASDARHDAIAELHVEGIMTAWYLGYMAGRKWLPPEEMELNVGTLGQGLRDQVRALGLPIDDLGLDLPAVVDQTLTEIAGVGLEDARTGVETRT